MQNTSRGKGKTFILLGVLLVVAGLTLGFAAFSNTLTIKSSATVTPDSSTFKVVFSSNSEKLETNGITPYIWDGANSEGFTGNELNGITATNAVINNEGNPIISGIDIGFTAPRQVVDYTFYVRNEGEYKAYLNEIKYNNVAGKNDNVVCTADKDENGNSLATQSLVDKACEGISIELFYGGESGIYTNDSLKIIPEYYEYELFAPEKGDYVEIYMSIYYEDDYGRADGPFTVEFGDIELVYSTVPNE